MHAAKITPHVNKGQVAVLALCTAAPQKQKSKELMLHVVYTPTWLD
jgi:hypothetical protein